MKAVYLGTAEDHWGNLTPDIEYEIIATHPLKCYLILDIDYERGAVTTFPYYFFKITDASEPIRQKEIEDYYLHHSAITLHEIPNAIELPTSRMAFGKDAEF